MSEDDILVSCETMSRIDSAAQEEIGIPGNVLMENAGRSAWEAMREFGDDPVVFCAGPGNNGGDALVMARWAMLDERPGVSVITVRRTMRGAAALQWKILERMGVERRLWTDEPDRCRETLAHAGTVVDGISGTGLSGALRGDAAALVEEINRLAAPVVAVDVPSGARDGYRSGEPLIRATTTVVTGYRKRCLYTAAIRASAGEIRQVDPGFPPQIIRRIDGGAEFRTPQIRLAREDNTIPDTAPAVPPDAYKGNRGRVGVIAGAPGTAGAAILAGLGALYGGAGMVRICSGAPVQESTALAVDPALMVVGDGSSAREETVAWADTLVIGPGWTEGTDDDLADVVRAALKWRRPIICDAHALRLLQKRKNGSGTARALLGCLSDDSPAVILTPHPGELAGLAGVDSPGIATDPWGVMDSVAAEMRVCIVLKGSVTLVRGSDGDVKVFDGRCPALGTAGSGDVLSGLIGAWCARVPDAGSAARIAVALHLDAGRSLAIERGWFTATDLARALGGGRKDARGTR